MKRVVYTKRQLSPADVAAVVPTRGDVDMRPIMEPLERAFGEVHVWDNSFWDDVGVYGRYEAIGRTTKPVIFTIDDDNVATPELINGLLDAYRPGTVVCNVPTRFRDRYSDSGLVGFGAIFDRDLPQRAFDLWHSRNGTLDTLTFRRTCDIVFTMLTPMEQVDLPYVELEYAHGQDRMWKQRGHFDEREQVRELCRRIKAAA